MTRTRLYPRDHGGGAAGGAQNVIVEPGTASVVPYLPLGRDAAEGAASDEQRLPRRRSTMRRLLLRSCSSSRRSSRRWCGPARSGSARRRHARGRAEADPALRPSASRCTTEPGLSLRVPFVSRRADLRPAACSTSTPSRSRSRPATQERIGGRQLRRLAHRGPAPVLRVVSRPGMSQAEAQIDRVVRARRARGGRPAARSPRCSRRARARS